MGTKKRDLSSLKEMVFTYLAINKIMYWIGVASETDGLEGVGQAVLQRLLNRDIVLILVIVFMYIFEYKFVMKQKRWTGIFAQIIIGIVGYVVFSVILITYQWAIHLIFSAPFDIIAFLGTMPGWTAIFFIVMVVLMAKEHFKKKSASEYALDIQSTNIKLEMLEALLDDGALSQEEFDKQKDKLFGV